MPALIKTLARPGIALNGALIGIVVLLGALIGAMSFPAPRTPEPMTHMELRAALMSCGLTAESLAAAGVSPERAAAVVGAAREHLAPGIQALRDAHEAVQNAGRALGDLQTAVRQGTAGDDPEGRLSEARARIDAAIAARAAIWSGIFDAAAIDIAPEQRQVIQAIHANSAWKLPAQYLVSDREEQAWVGLRDALDNIRVAARLGEAPRDDAVRLIQETDAQTAVAQALVNLGNRPAVTVAWEDATFDR